MRPTPQKFSGPRTTIGIIWRDSSNWPARMPGPCVVVRIRPISTAPKDNRRSGRAETTSTCNAPPPMMRHSIEPFRDSSFACATAFVVGIRNASRNSAAVSARFNLYPEINHATTGCLYL